MNDNLKKDFIILLGGLKSPEHVRMSNQGEDWLETLIVDSGWGRVQGTYIFSGYSPSSKGYLQSLKWECNGTWREEIPVTSLEKDLIEKNEELKDALHKAEKKIISLKRGR